MQIDAMDAAALARTEAALDHHYAALRAEGLNLDLTRGKPAGDQLDLSAALDGALDGGYRTEDGTDTRGYGGSDGIAEARRLGAEWLGLAPEEVLASGNSSLTLMYLFLLGTHRFGLDGPGSAWALDAGGARFLCPVPGYDRHFSICEDLGIEMVPVPMTGEGPDMARVEALVAGDPGVRGMWCVPRFSNPTGETYSADTVHRIAVLGRIAAPGFRVMWDNAYAVHDLAGDGPAPENVMTHCRSAGTEDSVVQFGSTSKVTFAGAGVAFFGGSRRNVDGFRKRLSVMTIGPDKVNQLRHTRLLPDMDAVRAHMGRHAELLRPKFECVRRRLEQGLGNLGIGRWTDPAGGYFVSFWTRPGLAKETVRLAAEAGVRLTPAGAAFPYGRDPEDSHIRLAPSFPPLAEVDRAMEVFVTCVRLATVRGARRDRGDDRPASRAGLPIAVRPTGGGTRPNRIGYPAPDMTDTRRSLETLLAQGGHFIDPETGAIVPPIHTATTYARDERYELIGYGYSRSGNPTCTQVEEVLAELEGAADALVFASGLAGITTFFDTVRTGERVVAPRVMYHGAADWLHRLAERRGIEVEFFDAAAPGALEAAVRAGETAVVWIEPSVNPTWDVIDVRGAAGIAHAAGAVLGVDATATPAVALRALDLGADVVFHSGTKYLAGHSDVTAGVLATRVADERWEDVKLARTLMGGVLGPFESWLLLRGMRTLHVRYERQAANAMAIARHFERHPKLDAVLYPGLESHPGHTVAKRQMTNGFGAMLSLLVAGDADAAKRVATRTRLFVPATSLGGVESLIEHRATVEGPHSVVPANLLRVSVGIENADELIADLEQALS